MRVMKGDTRSLDRSSYAGFQKLVVLFWGCPHKDRSILGSILGSPLLWETTI